eukprot:TRINITY_DN64773_c0_g1_i1.p1 TRINITY_DN64773_c0_g1~~TRINITY_DN64773_c0_g1_i1.p1  ORF type:complete len:102 (-),score=13.48 TRINITY_DN64773_c0_g1_i1:29-334(-)
MEFPSCLRIPDLSEDELIDPVIGLIVGKDSVAVECAKDIRKAPCFGSRNCHWVVRYYHCCKGLNLLNLVLVNKMPLQLQLLLFQLILQFLMLWKWVTFIFR